MSTSASHSPRYSPHNASGNGSPADDDEGIAADDDDSLLFSEEPVGWKSMTSSIKNHVHFGGRRYHRYHDGKYLLPNDRIEQDREHTKHEMLFILNAGRLFVAPIGDRPQKILDLGTGVGAWAIEVADTHPGAQVVGVDLSPIQPDMIPSNLDFLIDDVADEWVDPISRDFDLIHARDFLPLISDAPSILERSFNHLKPGGWIETQDFAASVSCDDETLPADSPLVRFWTQMHAAMQRAGCDLQMAPRIGELMQQIGFVNVQRRVIKVPIGDWKEGDRTQQHLGRLMRDVFGGLLGAAEVKLLPSLGMGEDQIHDFIATVREALNDDSVHSYMSLYSWVGQKAN